MAEATPATREDFDALSEVLRDLAQSRYDAGDAMAPALIAIRSRQSMDGKPVINLLPVDEFQSEAFGDMGKNLIAGLLHRFAAHPDTLVVGYISEAWTSASLKTAPSKDPERKEVLLLSILSAECQAMQMCPLTRAPDKVEIEVGEMTFLDEKHKFGGRFVRETPQAN